MSYIIIGGTNVAVGQKSGGRNVGGRNVCGTYVCRTKVAPPKLRPLMYFCCKGNTFWKMFFKSYIKMSSIKEKVR